MLIIGLTDELWHRIYKSNRLWLLWFVDYLGYYMLGASMAARKYSLNKYWYLSFYFITGAAATVINYIMKINNITCYNIHSSLSLTTALETLFLYSFFTLSEIKSNIFSRAAPYTFGIYLFHAMIVSLVFRNFKVLMQSLPFVTIPAASVLTTGLAFALTYLMTRNRFTRKVV